MSNAKADSVVKVPCLAQGLIGRQPHNPNPCTRHSCPNLHVVDDVAIRPDQSDKQP